MSQYSLRRQQVLIEEILKVQKEILERLNIISPNMIYAMHIEEARSEAKRSEKRIMQNPPFREYQVKEKENQQEKGQREKIQKTYRKQNKCICCGILIEGAYEYLRGTNNKNLCRVCDERLKT